MAVWVVVGDGGDRNGSWTVMVVGGLGAVMDGDPGHAADKGRYCTAPKWVRGWGVAYRGGGGGRWGPAAAADRKQRPDATCEGKNG